jgi:hypothetical protein
VAARRPGSRVANHPPPQKKSHNKATRVDGGEENKKHIEGRAWSKSFQYAATGVHRVHVSREAVLLSHDTQPPTRLRDPARPHRRELGRGFPACVQIARKRGGEQLGSLFRGGDGRHTIRARVRQTGTQESSETSRFRSLSAYGKELRRSITNGGAFCGTAMRQAQTSHAPQRVLRQGQEMM